MTFSPDWESTYAEGRHQSVWPWSDLVSYVYRYGRPKPGDRVLELGCGAGANIPFFLALGVDYFAVDGSATTVKSLHERFPSLQERIQVGDFTESLPFDGPFSMIVDRASVTSNNENSIRQALVLVHSLLAEKGVFIGIDWYSTAHSDYLAGDKAEDPWTRCNFESGQFAGLGRIHFSDEEHLRDLFSAFAIEGLEHKRIERVVPRSGDFASWNLLARKEV